MAFHVFPDPHTAPQSVGASLFTTPTNTINTAIAGETGPDTDNSEPGIPATSIPSTVFVRIAMQGPTPADPARRPTVFVRANAGAEVEVSSAFTYPTFASILDGVNPTDAAAGTRFEPDADNTYLVKVFVFISGITLNLRIRNNDVVAHDFVWVIGGSQASTRQPWIDILPVTLPPGATTNFDAVPGQTPPPLATLQVANKGTGPLDITDPVGTPVGGPNFSIDTVNTPVPPNATRDLKVAFSAPAAIGVTSTVYGLNSSDSLALTSAGHNRQISLSGTTRQLEVMMMLDTSGSMAFMPDGSAVVADPNESRWGRLKAASKQFLDLLGTLGAGQGRFAVGMFPDITTAACPAPTPSSADFWPVSDITAGNINSAKTALDGHSPVQNCAATPMGFGIGRSIGTVAGSFGYFLGSADALSFNKRYLTLMSDGAHNSGPPNPPDFFGAGPTSFKGKKIKAITVAYGDPTGTPFEVDHAMLSNISTQSADSPAEASTLTLDAGASDLGGLSLKKAFRTAIATGLTLDPTTDPGGVLTPGNPEARHLVTLTPYDTRAVFVVNWASFNSERVSVILITPNCEVITPATPRQNPDVFYSDHPTYAIYGVNRHFLSNTADPAHPRYGVWTLVITANLGVVIPLRSIGEDSEIYDYEVITDSRLKMHVATERAIYYAGDAIKLDALVALDGKGIPGAAVSLRVTAPGQAADTWLATNKVTAAEFEEARRLADQTDLSKIGVKAVALESKGLTFNDVPHGRTIPMADPNRQGLYSATVETTSTPGRYDFSVVATGTTEDGVTFRREKRITLDLQVRPAPEFTFFDILYRRDENQMVAQIRVLPRDRFGNILLLDPDLDARLGLTASTGEFTGPLVGNLDGSYSRELRYRPGGKPTIGLVFAGETVVVAKPVVEAEGLAYTNQVVEFKAGAEAEPGANQHIDPQSALGDITQKPAEVFVSLGASGELAVGIEGKIILAQGDDDVTVFVTPDEDLRAYRVDALPGPQRPWVTLGSSAGVTQSFGLKKGRLRSAAAIRVVDLSLRTRDASSNPLHTPGVSVAGVGVKKAVLPSEQPDCLTALLRWLAGLFNPRKAG